MLGTTQRRAARVAIEASQASIDPPLFLIPAFQTAESVRRFTISSQRFSQIGRAPLSIPPDVKFNFIDSSVSKAKGRSLNGGRRVEIEGPLGSLTVQIPPYMELEHDEATRKAIVKIRDAQERNQREMWGTTRAYLSNHILGVSEGHTAILRLVGVGYRATIENTATTVKSEYPGQQFVSLKVGFSHPIELGIPVGVRASVPQPTRILLEGIDKEKVNQFAARIRMWRKPEPYKGKGIFVNGETIKLKSKKIK